MTDKTHPPASAATLVQRLRDFYTEDETNHHIEHPICDEAAEEIERLRAALDAKRERCAKLCESNSEKWDAIGGDGGASLECADAIRQA
jgi:hypothetical protein